MAPKLKKFDNIFLKIIRAVTASLLAVMFVIIILEVIFRYALKSVPYWTEELARYVMFYMVLIGSSVAFRQKQHPTLGFIIQKFNKPFRKCWTFLIDVLLIFVLVVLLKEGYQIAVREKIGSTPALRISFYWVYLAIPIGAFLMIVQIIAKYIFGEKAHNNSSEEVSVSDKD